jgi:putative redox protein
MQVTVTAEMDTLYRQVVEAGGRTFFADVPPDKGGQNTAPEPVQMLLGAWGACVNMTLQMYANRKGWPLTSVSTTASEETQGSRRILKKSIELQGDLTTEQVDRLKAIAEKCPVNQLITGEKDVQIEFQHIPTANVFPVPGG